MDRKLYGPIKIWHFSGPEKDEVAFKNAREDVELMLKLASQTLGTPQKAMAINLEWSSLRVKHEIVLTEISEKLVST